jgi:SNF2 family DNA or RNA helicase
LNARKRALKQLSDDPTVNILLATVQSGGAGLNLQCATKIIIVEAWWNDARDQQAFSRLWRHGQKKAVECVRLLVKGSIDDRKIQLCNEKSEAIAQMTMKKMLE